MRRRFVFALGAVILGTGVWLISHEHARDMACKASTNVLQPASSACQAIAWDYFAGVVVTAIGVIVLLFTVLMRRHELRYRGHRDRPTEISLRMGPEASRRDAAPRRVASTKDRARSP